MTGEPSRSWSVARLDDERILVRFSGDVCGPDAVVASKAFLDALGDGKAEVWFDVRGVSRYDAAGRVAWQNVVLPRRHQLTGIAVASRSALTRMGATVFALFLGIPFRALADADVDAALSGH